jgi:hypothetical protein
MAVVFVHQLDFLQQGIIRVSQTEKNKFKCIEACYMHPFLCEVRVWVKD